mmetsp:Transcript_9302/g.12649  ORF Transcript_9302/g.12649 Transcript_9302/m.12649 type:complete len:331 (+) Transcript_9302:868-1860(+)
MCVTAGVNAVGFPSLGFIVAKVQMVLIGSSYNPEWIEERNDLLIIWVFLCIGLGSLAGSNKAMFGVTGENLTFNVRRDLIRGILFKQVQWFDREDRAPGILTNVLSEDVTSLNGMTTETVSTLVEACMGLFLGVIIASFISWRMALITIACSPVMIIGVVAMSRLQWGNKRGQSRVARESSGVDEYAKANALLSDVIINYRTVISFGQKNIEGVVRRFEQYLVEPSRKKVRNAHFGGFFFGYSNCARMLFLGIVFYCGSWLVQEGYGTSEEIYLSIWILFSTCMGTGIAMSNVPSVQKAKASAGNIFAIIDEKSSLDVREQKTGAKTTIE